MPSAHYVFRISDNGIDETHVGTSWTSILDAPGGSAMSISVNPIAGCQIRAQAKVQFGDTSTSPVQCGLRLQEDATTVDASYMSATSGQDQFVLTVGYTNVAPTPGTALTYTIDAVTSSGTLDVGYEGLDGPDPAVSWLEVEVLFP
jgi:dUTPase